MNSTVAIESKNALLLPEFIPVTSDVTPSKPNSRSRFAVLAGVLCIAIQGTLVLPSALETGTVTNVTSDGNLSPSCFAQSSISSGRWRRTAHGWELAKNLELQDTEEPQATNDPSSSIVWLHRIHSLVLPISLAIFIACFGSWCLVSLPNHAV